VRWACVLGAAVALIGCGDSEPPRPQVVSVLGAGSERATGFSLAPARVVTVAHAVSPRASIRTSRGQARVLRVDARTDLALLAVRGLRAPTLQTAAVEGGDSVRVLLLRRGRITTRSVAVRRAIEAHVSVPGTSRPLSFPGLELDARLRAGDSGAPVLTDDGELAGVLFARSRRDGRTAYAVDAKAVETLVHRLRRAR
jgi:S1-C subfamily serine protease